METKRSSAANDLRPEYEFDYARGERGRYYRRILKEEANVIVLEPDVAKAFPTSADVNDALRVILKAVRSARRTTGRGTRTRSKHA
jgi:hypothetical protein